MGTHWKWMAVALFAGLLAPAAVVAQDATTDYVPEGEIKQQEGKKQGMDGTFSLGANVNLASNSHVVGQVDGYSFLFGLTLLGGLDYVHGPHEVRNTLKLSQAWARTPVVDELIKANDVLDVESVYNYFILSWFGAFGRLNLETSILNSEDVRAEPATYRITRTNGDVDTAFTSRLTLADAFQPFTLNESVGLFAEPIQSKPFSLSIRTGIGARETFADGVLVLTNDDATPEVDVTELGDVYQAGVELFVGAKGEFQGKRVTYNVGGSVLVPFLNNDDQNRDAFALTKVGLTAGVNFSVFEWMAIVYTLKILDDPQLIDELQVQNNLLFTFNYTFLERNALPTAMVDEDVNAEKAKTTEAEKKAAAKEAEAAELRKELEALKAAEAEKKAAEEKAAAEKKAAEEKAAQEEAAEEKPEGDE